MCTTFIISLISRLSICPFCGPLLLFCPSSCPYNDNTSVIVNLTITLLSYRSALPIIITIITTEIYTVKFTQTKHYEVPLMLDCWFMLTIWDTTSFVEIFVADDSLYG